MPPNASVSAERFKVVCIRCGAEVFWSMPRPEDLCVSCQLPVGETVDDLSLRVAHAVHALLVATAEHPPMPRTAAEVCVFDAPEAYTPWHTGAALRQAKKLGFAANAGPYWIATDKALNWKRQFEKRYLQDTQ